MEIEVGKQYTSNGKRIKILCTDRQDDAYSVVGVDNNGAVHFFTKEGKSIPGPKYDLVSVKEEQKEKISKDKKYTSNGKLIRILTTDRPKYVHSIIGIDDDGVIYFFDEDGRISEDCVDLKPGETYYDYRLVKVWEPVNGEWCLFWDTNEQDGAILSRFCKMTDDGIFQSWNGLSWKHCIKFDGTLPVHLKGV
jgi:hypothetical protein